MNSDLRELYQEMILDHNRAPHNFGALSAPAAHVTGDNPLCGDHIDLFVRMDGETVDAVTFSGHGCAISRASASMLTDAVSGLSRAAALHLFERFHALVTGGDPGGDLGKLQVFAGVREFPSRVKCAALPWHALRAALLGSGEPVTTEADA